MLGAVATFVTAETVSARSPSPTPAPTFARPAPTAVATTPTAVATTPAPAPGTNLRVYVAAYGWWDNTPHGSSAISKPVLHKTAGGTGTYADPITAAVPYHCANGCLQWPAGTRFYVPSLKRYLIVEDTCGDDGPDTCDGTNGNQLVVWVGRSATAKDAESCEDRVTGTTTAVEHPASDLAVTPGDIC